MYSSSLFLPSEVDILLDSAFPSVRRGFILFARWGYCGNSAVDVTLLTLLWVQGAIIADTAWLVDAVGLPRLAPRFSLSVR